MKKAEKIIVTLSFIALGMNLLLIPFGGVLTVLTLSLLSMFYFYLAFALFNGISLRKIFKKDSYKAISPLRIMGAIGAGLSLSMTAIGILFKFQSWPGAELNLGAGLVGLVLVTLVGLFRYFKERSDFYTGIFKRAAILGVLGFILFLTPATTWVELKYRNYPDYVEALKKSMADPENTELWEKAEVERQRMNSEN